MAPLQNQGFISVSSAFPREPFIPEFAPGTPRSGKGELKRLESLQCYKVDQETPEPEFEKVPSRSLLIMARLGEWNKCLLSARCNVSTFQRF